MNFCYPLTRFIYECPAIVSPTCVGLAIPRLISLFLLLLQLLRNNNNNFLLSLLPAQCVHHYTTIEMLFGVASPRLDVQRGKLGACGVLGFSQRPTETDCQGGRFSRGTAKKNHTHTHTHTWTGRFFNYQRNIRALFAVMTFAQVSHICVWRVSVFVQIGG